MNFNKYIGIPYKENGLDFNGIDCFGVCHLIYNEELGIDLYKFTDYVKYNVYTPEKTHTTVCSQLPRILTIMKEVTLPYQIYDLLLIYQSAKKDIVNHMGIYIGDNKFIHSVENRESMVSRLKGYYTSKIYKVLRRRDDI